MLRELEACPNIREAWNYTAELPEITRVALGAVGIEFAQQLATGIPESPTAFRQISLEMVDAQLAEARGELDRAEELYASAEEGWRTFSVPERAQSLLGRGRCLLAMGEPEAAAVLREANEVFASLKAELYIPEVKSLLEQAARTILLMELSSHSDGTSPQERASGASLQGRASGRPSLVFLLSRPMSLSVRPQGEKVHNSRPVARVVALTKTVPPNSVIEYGFEPF